MTSLTARNRKALVERNGSTLPEAKPAPAKTVAKSNEVVAKGKDQPVVAEGNEAPKATPTPVSCHCGCGAEANLGRTYRPGHDARHAGVVGRMLAEGNDGAQAALAQLPPALQAKAQRFADNRAKEAARKDAAAKLRADAKAALKAQLAAL